MLGFVWSLIVVYAVTGPMWSLAAAPRTPADAMTATQASSTPTALHAVRGVVKSVSAVSLVITRGGKKPSDLVLVLKPSTLRSGALTVGSMVAVRYHVEGKTLVATAVTGATHVSPISTGAK